MIGQSRRSMASDRSQNCDIRNPTKLHFDENLKTSRRRSFDTMKDPKIKVVDVPESLLVSVDLRDLKNYDPQRLLPHGHDFTDPTEKRSTSWPAVPRWQSFPLQKRIESFQRRTERLKSSRDRAQLIRMDLKFHRQNYRQQHTFVDESQRNLHDHIEKMLKDDDLVTTRDDYLLYYARARDDYFRLEEQTGIVQALENELTALEEIIERLETQLNLTSGRILVLLGHQDPSSRDEDGHRDANQAVGAPTEIFSSDGDDDIVSMKSSHGNPLLDDYFDKAGNVRVARARLLELYKEHDEKHVARSLKEDQGAELPVTDTVFEIECDIEVKAAQQAIQEAIILKDNAKQACRKNGIDTDQHRHASEVMDDDVEAWVPDGMETEAPRLIRLRGDKAGPFTIVTTTGPYGEAVAVAVDDDEPDLPPFSETVEKWIDSMPQTQINPLLEHANAEETTPKSSSPSRVTLLTHELEPYFAKREDAETIAQLVIRNTELSPWAKQDLDPVPSLTGSSILLNHSRSSSEPRLAPVVQSDTPEARIEQLRGELQQYLLKHGSAKVIRRLSRLGIELSSSTKEDINHIVTQAKTTLSDHSRSSSESRLSALFRTDIPRSSLIASIPEVARGRRS